MLINLIIIRNNETVLRLRILLCLVLIVLKPNDLGLVKGDFYMRGCWMNEGLVRGYCNRLGTSLGRLDLH
jgi:hypothetical protein